MVSFLPGYGKTILSVVEMSLVLVNQGEYSDEAHLGKDDLNSVIDKDKVGEEAKFSEAELDTAADRVSTNEKPVNKRKIMKQEYSQITVYHHFKSYEE